MLIFKKSIPLLISMMMLFIVSACSEASGSLQQAEQNQEGTNIETRTPDPAKDPSSSISSEVKSEDVVTFDPVVLFELTDEDLSKPVTEILYYVFGNIGYVTEEVIKSVAEGHSPWKGSSVHAAEILTQNLVPEGISADQVKYNVVHVENENQADELTVVDMIVPDLGTFTINLQYPGNSGISFITNIVWQPADSQSLDKLKDIMTEPLIIYNLREEDHFSKDDLEFPSYQNGRIWFTTNKDIENIAEGHSPWRTVPFDTTEAYTRNLIPENISVDNIKWDGKLLKSQTLQSGEIGSTIAYETIREEGDLTTFAVIVPTFGTYEVTLLGKYLQHITKISFHPKFTR